MATEKHRIVKSPTPEDLALSDQEIEEIRELVDADERGQKSLGRRRIPPRQPNIPPDWGKMWRYR